jgi:hypothetical protein
MEQVTPKVKAGKTRNRISSRRGSKIVKANNKDYLDSVIVDE